MREPIKKNTILSTSIEPYARHGIQDLMHGINLIRLDMHANGLNSENYTLHELVEYAEIHGLIEADTEL